MRYGAPTCVYDEPVDVVLDRSFDPSGSLTEIDKFPRFDLPALGSSGHVYDSSANSVAPSGVPRGFGSASDFGAFGDDLYSGLRGAGYDDVTAIFQGSSVTGQSFRTGAAFDVGRVSDFDIALASPQLLDRASALGIGLRSGGTRTGPLTASQLQRLGLGDLATDLGTSAGRPVHFMIFDSAAGATARSPSIVVPG